MSGKYGNKRSMECAARDVAEMFFGNIADKDEQHLSNRTGHSSQYWVDFDAAAKVMADIEPLTNDTELRAAVDKYDQPKTTVIKGRSGMYTWSLAAAATLLLGLVLTYWTPFEFGAPDGVSLRYLTRIGEQKSVSLEDGSVITLNTGTEILVHLTDKQREVILQRGEAYFDVARDPTRPFTVTLGNRSVSVLGTEFNLFKTPDRFVLAVMEGVVAIHNKEDEASLAAPRLQASEREPMRIVDPGQYRIEAGTVVELDERKRELIAYAPKDIGRRQSWRKGIIRFYEASLSDVIQELNRYSAKKISIQDASVMDLKVFATVRINEPNMSLVTLEKLLPIRVIRHFDRAVIVSDDSRRRSPNFK